MDLALAVLLALGLLAAPSGVLGQTPANVHRVGIIHVSGHHHVVVDGLRQGLRELGLEEGKQLVLDIREIDGDPKAAEQAASRTTTRSDSPSISASRGRSVSRSRSRYDCRRIRSLNDRKPRRDLHQSGHHRFARLRGPGRVW